MEHQVERRFRHWHAALIFLVVTLIVFGDVLVSGDRVLSKFGEDGSHLFLGTREFAFQELSHGRFPLWNPYLYCGTPYFAGFQAALLYPLNWIYALLPNALAFNVDIALHIWLSGLFMYAWAAHHRFHPAASVIGGLTYMLGGPHFLHVYAGHLPQLCTITWMPVMLLAIDLAFEVKRWRAVLGTVLFGSAVLAVLVFAGFPQIVLYFGIIAGVYVVGRLVFLPRGSRRMVAVTLLSLLIVGAGISAVQWIAGWGVVEESARKHLPWSIASSYSLPVENLLTLLTPGVFGGTGQQAYWGRWYLWEVMAFVGVIPLLLAVYGAITGPRRRRLLALALVVLSMLLALGAQTPLYGLLYDFVPTVDGFRGPSKFLAPALLWICVLAVAGAHQLFTSDARRRGPVLTLSVFVVILVISAIAIYSSAVAGPGHTWDQILTHLHWNLLRFMEAPDASTIRQFGVAAARWLLWPIVGCGAGLVLLLVPRRFAPVLGACVVGIEMILFAVQYRPTFSMNQIYSDENVISKDMLALPADARLFYVNQSVMFRLRAQTVFGNDAMLLRRYVDLAGALEGVDRTDDPTRLAFTAAVWPLRLLRFAAVVNQDQNGDLVLYRVPWQPLSHALLMPSWQAMTDRVHQGQALRDPTFPMERVALVDTAPAFPTSAAATPGPASELTAHVEIKDISTDELEIRATTPARCILLITDNYASGWRATPLEPGPQKNYDVMPADVAFRAIPLLPGTHHILLEYRPVAFEVGKWISAGATFLWLLGLGAWDKWRRRWGAGSCSAELSTPGRGVGRL